MYFWTVARSSPPRRQVVANVARNLCNQQSSGSSPARSATAFTHFRKSSFGLHPLVGKSRLQFLSAVFVLHALSSSASLGSRGIERSLYCFGVHPLSGLCVTRTTPAEKLTSVQ